MPTCGPLVVFKYLLAGCDEGVPEGLLVTHALELLVCVSARADIYFLFLWHRISLCSSGWPQSHSVAQVDLKLKSCCLSHERWDHRCLPLCWPATHFIEKVCQSNGPSSGLSAWKPAAVRSVRLLWPVWLRVYWWDLWESIKGHK